MQRAQQLIHAHTREGDRVQCVWAGPGAEGNEQLAELQAALQQHQEAVSTE